LFQVVGPATANERGPWVDNLTGGTISWLLCDDRSWYLGGPYQIKSNQIVCLHTTRSIYKRV